MMAARRNGGPPEASAIVVGAGPAGSATAFFLATLGHDVILLDRRRFPRDKACGDGITNPGVNILEEMGALGPLRDSFRFYGLRAHVRRRRSRELRYPTYGDSGYGLVVPRLRLDEVLRRRAEEAGAKVFEDTLATEVLHVDGRAVGVRAVRDGQETALFARFVVCADGGNSGLARKAGLIDTPRTEVGYGLRGYYENIGGLDELIEFWLPLLDPSDQFFLPSYGWAFPTSDATANVGVGVMVRAHGANVRRLFERFEESLRATDPRFETMTLRGQWRGAPVRCDFSPERCVAPGVVLVGDAAGMISRFTGEGISYALEAGKLAAEAIHRSYVLGCSSTTDLADYSGALRRLYSGYFETGREIAKRYQLGWRILESTFDNDRPLFTLTRRAALLPEGVGGLRTSDVLDEIADLVAPIADRLRTDLRAVDEALIRTLHRDWPFLSRLAASAEHDTDVPARPAALALMCAYLGNPDGHAVVSLAAAIELSFLAALAQSSLEDEPHDRDVVEARREPNWGNLFAVLASNFQLAKAYQLGAGLGTEVLRQLAACMIEVCEGRAREIVLTRDPDLTSDAYVDVVSGTTGAMFEAVCRLGGWAGGLPPEQLQTLGGYGRELGIAFQLSEETMNVAGRSSPAGPFATCELRRGRLTLPVAVALQRGGPLGYELRELLSLPERSQEDAEAAIEAIAASPALPAALSEVGRRARAAEEATDALPAGAVRDALRDVARHQYTRAVEDLSQRCAGLPAAIASSTNGSAWTLPESLGLAGDVRRLSQFITRWVESVDPELHEVVGYQLFMHAKYFRPVTIFACHRSECDGPVSDELVRVAAALELLHNSTLVFDDVLDRSRYRRGALSLHCRFGTLRALMAATFWSSATTDWIAEDPYTVRLLAELWQRLALAEALQWRLRRKALGVDEWRRIAGEDTGSMFEVCARLGTRDERLRRFGYLLGTLYHGCDDVADVRGAAALGGGSEKDITDRILTLPAAIAIRDGETAELFLDGGREADDELAERFAAILPDAEEILDGLAREAEEEALRSAGSPDRLIELVRHTRALSRA